jgi:hypothetical protein
VVAVVALVALVALVAEVAKLTDCDPILLEVINVPPEAGLVAVAALPPIDRPDAVPVIFVPTNALGVPNAGVTKVGDVLRTTEPDPVDVVTPVPPEVTARAVDKVTEVKDATDPD